MQKSHLIPIGKIPDYLGVKFDIGTIYRWRTKGLRIGHDKIRLPSVRIGGRFYVEKHELENFLERLNTSRAEVEKRCEALLIKGKTPDMIDQALDSLGV